MEAEEKVDSVKQLSRQASERECQNAGGEGAEYAAARETHISLLMFVTQALGQPVDRSIAPLDIMGSNLVKSWHRSKFMPANEGLFHEKK